MSRAPRRKRTYTRVGVHRITPADVAQRYGLEDEDVGLWKVGYRDSAGNRHFEVARHPPPRRHPGPRVKARRNGSDLARAVAEANAVSARLRGPKVSARSPRSMIRWLRWNDRDGDYPMAWADSADDVGRAFVNVVLERTNGRRARARRSRR